MKRDIGWYVYEPLNWERKTADENQCRHKVAGEARSVGSRQCFRKSVETVDGYGFCKMHANKVRDISLNENDVTFYAANLSRYGHAPEITKLIARETPKMYIAKNIERIYGDNYNFVTGGHIDKSAVTVFTTEYDAWVFLAGMTVKHQVAYEKKAKEMDEQHNMIMDIIKKKKREV